MSSLFTSVYLFSSHFIPSLLISSHRFSFHPLSSHLISPLLISSPLFSSPLFSSYPLSSHFVLSPLFSSHLTASNIPLIIGFKILTPKVALRGGTSYSSYVRSHSTLLAECFIAGTVFVFLTSRIFASRFKIHRYFKKIKGEEEK